MERVQSGVSGAGFQQPQCCFNSKNQPDIINSRNTFYSGGNGPNYLAYLGGQPVYISKQYLLYIKMMARNCRLRIQNSFFFQKCLQLQKSKMASKMAANSTKIARKYVYGHNFFYLYTLLSNCMYILSIDVPFVLIKKSLIRCRGSAALQEVDEQA